jgi:hypothetical protein
MAPRPPSPHLSSQQLVSISQSSYVSPVKLTDGGGEGVGEEPKSNDLEKAWPSVNQSTISDVGQTNEQQHHIIEWVANQ